MALSRLVGFHLKIDGADIGRRDTDRWSSVGMVVGLERRLSCPVHSSKSLRRTRRCAAGVVGAPKLWAVLVGVVEAVRLVAARMSEAHLDRLIGCAKGSTRRHRHWRFSSHPGLETD